MSSRVWGRGRGRGIAVSALVMIMVMVVIAGRTPSRVFGFFDPPNDAADALVGKTLEKMTDRLDDIADRAERTGDYLVEKNARMLHILTQNIGSQLDGQKDEALDRLSIEHQKLLASAGRLVDEVGTLSGRMLELEDFLAIDLSDALNLLPANLAKSRVAALRRIDGYSQVFQEDGVYTFRVIGNGFGPGNRCKVKVNGATVNDLDMRMSKAHTLEFDVPVGILNPSFRDEETARVEMELACWKGDSEKPTLQHKAKLLLLPRYPVQCSLIEHRAEPIWSKETYWSAEGRAQVAKRGTTTVSARVPDGCLMLKETVTTSPTAEELRRDNLRVQRYSKNAKMTAWSEETSFTDEDRTVSRTLRFFGAERKPPIDVSIKVQYRKPTTRPIDSEARIQGATANRRLPFGTSFAKFAAGRQSHTLYVKWFNGKRAVLTPTRTAAPGVRTELEGLKNFARLTIQVEWPESRTRG